MSESIKCVCRSIFAVQNTIKKCTTTHRVADPDSEIRSSAPEPDPRMWKLDLFLMQIEHRQLRIWVGKTGSGHRDPILDPGSVCTRIWICLRIIYWYFSFKSKCKIYKKYIEYFFPRILPLGKTWSGSGPVILVINTITKYM